VTDAAEPKPADVPAKPNRWPFMEKWAGGGLMK
jgi:hypothetical protein